MSTFRQRLAKSQPYVGLVAAWLSLKGHEVRIFPAGDRDDDQLDQGDLAYSTQRGFRTLEIKRLSKNFSNQADWPFRNVIVDAQISINSKDYDYPLAGYLSLSKDLKHYAFLPGTTRRQWSVEVKENSVVGGSKPYVVAPYSLLRFGPFHFR